MKLVWRSLLIGVLAFLFITGQDPALAHGDEPHGTPEQTVAEAGVGETETGAAAQAPSAGAEHGHNVVAQSSPLDILTMLHPATVHFPIALLLLAAVLEVALVVRPRSGLEPTIRIVLYFAAGGTIIAALFGWIHTGMWMGGALRACLTVAAIAVILQSYWGAELSHGPGHLSAHH